MFSVAIKNRLAPITMMCQHACIVFIILLLCIDASAEIVTYEISASLAVEGGGNDSLNMHGANYRLAVVIDSQAAPSNVIEDADTERVYAYFAPYISSANITITNRPNGAADLFLTGEVPNDGLQTINSFDWDGMPVICAPGTECDRLLVYANFKPAIDGFFELQHHWVDIALRGDFFANELKAAPVYFPDYGEFPRFFLPGDIQSALSTGIALSGRMSPAEPVARYVTREVVVKSSADGRFDDVLPDHWAFRFIEILASSGITRGCDSNNFCPDDFVTRAQMAVFLERGMRGGDFRPPAAAGDIFLDVGAGDFAASFIEQLYVDGITSGCGNRKYCPTHSVTRAQMAVFLLRVKHGPSYHPPAAKGTFDDVPIGSFADAWIDQLAAEGITSGCGANFFCPDDPVTRSQMAVFLTKTLGLSSTEIVAQNSFIPAPTGIDFQHGSVAMEGSTIVVGDYITDPGGNCETQTGKLYIYEHDAQGQWVLASEVRPVDLAPIELFGSEVGLSGNQLFGVSITADSSCSTDSGYVHVFERVSGSEWRQTQKLSPSDGIIGDAFGSSFLVKGDLMLVGASGANAGIQGATYVFRRDAAGLWSEEAKIEDLAFSASLSIRGSRVLIGGNLYEKGANGLWAMTTQLLPDDDALGGSLLSSTLTEGWVLQAFHRSVVCGSFQRPECNALYTFAETPTAWEQWQKLVASDERPTDGATFGARVDADGTRAVVTSASGGDSASIYYYHLAGGEWSEVVRLVGVEQISNDWFGRDVSVDGQFAAVFSRWGIFVFYLP